MQLLVSYRTIHIVSTYEYCTYLSYLSTHTYSKSRRRLQESRPSLLGWKQTGPMRRRRVSRRRRPLGLRYHSTTASPSSICVRSTPSRVVLSPWHGRDRRRRRCWAVRVVVGGVEAARGRHILHFWHWWQPRTACVFLALEYDTPCTHGKWQPLLDKWQPHDNHTTTTRQLLGDHWRPLATTWQSHDNHTTISARALVN